MWFRRHLLRGHRGGCSGQAIRAVIRPRAEALNSHGKASRGFENQESNTSGAKALTGPSVTARLKSCPDTKHEIFAAYKACTERESNTSGA